MRKNREYKTAKQSRKKKSGRSKLSNGEYIDTPNSLSALKKYVETYYRAVGWKSADYEFPFNRSVHIRDLKIKKNKETASVEVSFRCVLTGGNEMYAKRLSKSYTIENHKSVRSDIVNIGRQVKFDKRLNTMPRDRAVLESSKWHKVF